MKIEDMRFYSQCNLCPLGAAATSVCVGYRGCPQPTMLIVGEAPGPREDRAGKPFVGPAGRELSTYLREAEVDEAVVAFTNIVRCFPSEEKEGRLVPRAPTEEELHSCVDYLYKEIDSLSPKVIVTLGKSASTFLVPELHNRGITSIRGQFHEIEIFGKKYPVVPTLHPAAVLRGNFRARQDIVGDIRDAFRRTVGNYGSSMPETKVITDIESLARLVAEFIEGHRAGQIPYVAYDLETTSLVPYDDPESIAADSEFHGEPSEIIGVALSASPTLGYYVELRSLPINRAIPYFRNLLESVPLVVHNGKFDLSWTQYRWGIRPSIIHSDTLLSAYLSEGGDRSLTLKALTRDFCGFTNYDEELRRELDKLPLKDRNMGNIPGDILAKYGAYDAVGTFQLAGVMDKRLNQVFGGRGLLDFLLDASSVFMDIEMRGVPIDREFLLTVRHKYELRMKHLYLELLTDPYIQEFFRDNFLGEGKPTKRRAFLNKKEFQDALHHAIERLDIIDLSDLRKAFKFSPLSTQQMCEIVFSSKYMGLPMQERTESKPPAWAEGDTGIYGNPSLNKESVDSLLDYLKQSSTPDYYKDTEKPLRDFSAFKRLQKLLGYLDGFDRYRMPGKDKIRVNYLIHGTSSGRFSTRDMSLHTFPWKSDIKKGIVSEWHGRGGIVLSADYSQVELRVLASLSGDEDLIQVFQDGQDIHRYVASKVYRKPLNEVTSAERRNAKAVSFGIVYEQGAEGMASSTGLSVEESEAIIEDYLTQFPKVRDYMESAHREVLKHGYVQAPHGRIRYLPHALSSDASAKAKALRQANNHKIQSLATDCTLLSILIMSKEFRSQGMRTREFGFVHDSVLVDVYPGELTRALQIQRSAMEDRVGDHLPYMKVPLLSEIELGSRLGASISLVSGFSSFSSDTELPETRVPMRSCVEGAEAFLPMSADPSQGVLLVEGRLSYLQDIVESLMAGEQKVYVNVFEVTSCKEEDYVVELGLPLTDPMDLFKCKAMLKVST